MNKQEKKPVFRQYPAVRSLPVGRVSPQGLLGPQKTGLPSGEVNAFLEEFEAGDRDLARHLLELRHEPGPELKGIVLAIPHASPRYSYFFSPRLSWGLIALLGVVLLFFSPTAKAGLSQVKQFIGQIQLTVLEVLPGHDRPGNRESRKLSLKEAQAMMPFALATPTYLPAGLASREPEVSLIELKRPMVKILWREHEGGFIQLTTHQPYEGETGYMETLIGPNSSQTIFINGQQAVLIYGGWDEESHQWGHRDRLKTLIWEVDQIQYKLLYFGDTIPTAELVAMAESIH